MKKMILILATIFLFAIFVSTASAQENIIPAETEDLSEAGYTPDSPIYGLERAMERLQLFFAGSEEAKARLHVQHAYERLVEARVMEQKGKPEFVGKLLTDYNDAIANAEAEIAKAESKGKDMAQLRIHVAEMTQKHIAVLTKVMENAPEQAQQGLQTALNNAYQRQERMREQFEGGGQEQRGTPGQGQQNQGQTMCVENEDCQLSLCDCDCYKAGETPEEQEGVLCGINCAAEFNVLGCECVDGECEKVPAHINPGGQDNQTQ